MTENNDELIDYCELSFSALAAISSMLNTMLKDASKEDRLKSVCCICEALLTCYLKNCSIEEKEHYLHLVYQGAFNGETLKR